MDRRIDIFDTTLRDGEQSPGCSMTTDQKLEFARRLEKLGVDVMEAGFPVASEGDFNSVRTIATEIRGTQVAALARAVEKDIDTAWEAVKEGENPRLHIFIATSPLHMKYKLRKTEEQVLEQAVEMLKYGRRYCDNIEFSAEDATRSDPEFLYRVIEGAVNAGAGVINVPDTVGYAEPEEFYRFIRGIKENVPAMDRAKLSVHCHNDLGLATANSLAAVKAGADQVECTVNGIGERAGNAALEEIVMNLFTRKDIYKCDFGVVTEEIYGTSKLLERITGSEIQRNKAIVGENAFAHESGIHQHGVIENSETYEIITPSIIGLERGKLVLGKHSGKHAFLKKASEMGYELEDEEMVHCFRRFKAVADMKKEITDEDIREILEEERC